MENADHIIDLGPEAGNKGGTVVAEGTYEDILKNNDSITGRYLSNKSFIPIPKSRRLAKNGRFLEINGATCYNLNIVNLKIPLGSFTCVSGVSGSGKSTLILQTLYYALVRVCIHQKYTTSYSQSGHLLLLIHLQGLYSQV